MTTIDLSTGTPPSPASTYLEEGAAELRKAREANERRFNSLPSLAAGQVPADELARILAEVNTRRMEIAEGFTRLAAIERGQPPCYHPARPEREQGTP